MNTEIKNDDVTNEIRRVHNAAPELGSDVFPRDVSKDKFDTAEKFVQFQEEYGKLMFNRLSILFGSTTVSSDSDKRLHEAYIKANDLTKAKYIKKVISNAYKQVEHKFEQNKVGDDDE